MLSFPGCLEAAAQGSIPAKTMRLNPSLQFWQKNPV